MPSITLQFTENEAQSIKKIASLNGKSHTTMIRDLIIGVIVDPVKESLLKHISELEQILFIAHSIQDNNTLRVSHHERFVNYMLNHNLDPYNDFEALAKVCQILQERLDFLRCSLKEEEAVSSVDVAVIDNSLTTLDDF